MTGTLFSNLEMVAASFCFELTGTVASSRVRRNWPLGEWKDLEVSRGPTKPRRILGGSKVWARMVKEKRKRRTAEYAEYAKKVRISLRRFLRVNIGCLTLRAANCSVAVAEAAPLEVEGWVVADGILGGGGFVEVDAEAWFFVADIHAVFNFGAAGEDFLGSFVEGHGFLDAEVPGGEAEVDVGGVADGTRVAGAVPGGADAEEVAEVGDFTGHADAADLGDVAADEIDEAFADEVDVFVGVVEEFAHGDGGVALLAEDFEVGDVFGGEGVFEEEGAVWFEFFAEADGVDGIEAFVDVVEEFGFVAELFADVFEKFWDGAAVGGGFKFVAFKMASEVWGGWGVCRSAGGAA